MSLSRMRDAARRDLKKLANRAERYRYVFFVLPRYPNTTRLPRLKRDVIEVRSVEV